LITLEQFQQQAAEGHTRIPVVREVLSDLDTPLSVYLKLADGPHTYLFESVEGGERFGRYSIIGLPARRVYAFHGHTLTVSEAGQVVETREVADPFTEVEALRSAHSVPKLAGLPGFTAYTWVAGMVSAKTPKAETEKLAALLTKIEKMPETREFYERIGAEVMQGGPEEMRNFQNAEIQLWKRIAVTARVEQQ